MVDPTLTSFNAVAALVVDAEARPRDRGEPRCADRLAADLTRAEAAVLDARQRRLDVDDGLLGAFLEPVLQLAVERRGRSVGHVVVDAAAADLAELVLDGAGVVALEERDGVGQPRELLLEALLERAGVDVAHVDFLSAARSPKTEGSARLHLPPGEVAPGGRRLVVLDGCERLDGRELRRSSGVTAWNSRVSSRLGHCSGGSSAAGSSVRDSSTMPSAVRRSVSTRRASANRRSRSACATRVIDRASWRASARISSASRSACSFASAATFCADDERGREERLPLLDLREQALDVFELVGQLPALAPDLFEAVRDVLDQAVRVRTLVTAQRASDTDVSQLNRCVTHALSSQCSRSRIAITIRSTAIRAKTATIGERSIGPIANGSMRRHSRR